MAKKIRVIPATKNTTAIYTEDSVQKRKVAGYARVSTGSDEQFTSYEAQVEYYTNYIKSHSDWEFVGIYTDEGISATSTKHRKGFKSMIADALDGKINLIVTKSVSRFARNTVDSLTTIRKLKENNVECYFEKENIWTFDSKGELLITIMSSLAQEESRSISENVTWGQRKRIAEGRVSLAYSNFLGYDKGDDENAPLVINPEQAKVVKKIYSLYISGKSYQNIAHILMDEGIPTPAGKKKWSTTTIKSILTNEKYKGDARLQKSFTTDFLTKKSKINEGEVPQYYIENSHEAIISPEEWDLVQDIMKRRSNQKTGFRGTTIFSSKIVCCDCWAFYGRKVWHSTDKYRKVVLSCNYKYADGKPKCNSPTLTEDELKTRFLSAYNKVLADKKRYIVYYLDAKKLLPNTDEIKAKMAALMQETKELSKQIQDYTDDSTTQQSQENIEKYNTSMDKYNKDKSDYNDLFQLLSDTESKKCSINVFVESLSNHDKPLTEFDETLWSSIIHKVYTKKDGGLVFTFNVGLEITA